MNTLANKIIKLESDLMCANNHLEYVVEEYRKQIVSLNEKIALLEENLNSKPCDGQVRGMGKDECFEVYGAI